MRLTPRMNYSIMKMYIQVNWVYGAKDGGKRHRLDWRAAEPSDTPIPARGSRRMFEEFEIYRPPFVYHVGAHKHVPLMEDIFCGSINNNASAPKRLPMSR